MKWKCRMTKYVQLLNFLFILWIMFSRGRMDVWLQWIEMMCRGNSGNKKQVHFLDRCEIDCAFWWDVRCMNGNFPFIGTQWHWETNPFTLILYSQQCFGVLHFSEDAIDWKQRMALKQSMWAKWSHALRWFSLWGGGLVAEWWMRKWLWLGILVVVLTGTNLKGRAWSFRRHDQKRCLSRCTRLLGRPCSFVQFALYDLLSSCNLILKCTTISFQIPPVEPIAHGSFVAQSTLQKWSKAQDTKREQWKSLDLTFHFTSLRQTAKSASFLQVHFSLHYRGWYRGGRITKNVIIIVLIQSSRLQVNTISSKIVTEKNN